MTPVSVLYHYVRNHVQTVTLNNTHVESLAGLLWAVLLYLTSAGPRSSGPDWTGTFRLALACDGCLLETARRWVQLEHWESWVLSVSLVSEASPFPCGLSLGSLCVVSPTE